MVQRFVGRELVNVFFEKAKVIIFVGPVDRLAFVSSFVFRALAQNLLGKERFARFAKMVASLTESRFSKVGVAFGGIVVASRVGTTRSVETRLDETTESLNRERLDPPGLFRARKERCYQGGSRDYRRLSRVTFSGTTASARSNLTVQEGARRGNTRDKLESCLSARLPRIMDVTVTRVNEAHRLHLLHLRALATARSAPSRL